VHDALGNAFAVEMGDLLDQACIFQQHGTVFAGGQAVLIITDGGAGLARKGGAGLG
jgi:hypothetical protein